jgi:hypothetical protein
LPDCSALLCVLPAGEIRAGGSAAAYRVLAKALQELLTGNRHQTLLMCLMVRLRCCKSGAVYQML